jgi:hypothetical protein
MMMDGLNLIQTLGVDERRHVANATQITSILQQSKGV